MDSSILSGLSASLRRTDQMKKTRLWLGCSGIYSKRGEGIVPAIQHGCFKDGREKEELLFLVERGLGICEIDLTD